MFREMRRKKQLLSEEESIAMLKSCNEGVMAVLGDEGYPYAVPLNHVYHEGKLYFHSAIEGHKLSAIANCDKVSYCVIEKRDIVPEDVTTYFRSVIAFGRARLVTEEAEKRAALILLGRRFAPDFEEKWQREINESMARTGVIELAIEHLTGKECIELVKARQPK